MNRMFYGKSKLSPIEPLESRIAPAVFLVTSLADTGLGTLRDEVAAANAHGGNNIVAFKSGLHGVINLTGGEIAINSTLAINGPGDTDIVINAGGKSRIFNVSAKASITGLAMINGSALGNLGGAVYDVGDLLVNKCIISGSTAANGGGIASSDAVLLIENSIITGNKATNGGLGVGGGVYINVTSANLTVLNDTIVGNYADGTGGGIAAELRASPGGRTLTISGCTISGNTAQNLGGGAYVFQGSYGGATKISNNMISGNQSAVAGGMYLNAGLLSGPTQMTGGSFLNNQGGGLKDVAGQLTITGGLFAGNTTATQDGGGIYISSNSLQTSTLKGTHIMDNSARNGGGIVSGTDTNLVLSGVTIYNNHAADTGGGFFAESLLGTTKITGSVITHNVADANGGGLYLGNASSITVQSTTVSDNVSGNAGGGIDIFSDNTKISLLANTISDNSAGGPGGGLYLGDSQHFLISTGSFTGNTSASSEGGGGIFIGLEASGIIDKPVHITGNFSDGPGGGVSHASGATGVVAMSTTLVTGNIGGGSPVELNVSGTFM